MSLPQSSLLERLRAGDVDALADLYDTHAEAVFRHAYHLLGREEDAHDIRQETFLCAWRSIGSFRGDCALKTWLFTICTNLCRTHSRKAHVRRETGLEALPSLRQEQSTHYPDPFDAVSDAQMAAVIHRVLDHLPASAREIIVLRDVEGLPMEEIARIAGCTRASAAVRLFRARAMLRMRVKAILAEGE